MVSTHMGYGFVFAYLLTLLFERIFFPSISSEIASLNALFALLGLVGGLFPDIDRRFGSHRKTLHYVTGYGLIAIVFMALKYFFSLPIWTLGFSCFFAGAWLHSLMDIFDGF